jgi:hypothetical protein
LTYAYETKYFPLQVVAGVINVVNYEDKNAVQVRRVSNTYTSAIKHVDLAIAKVNQPFVINNTVKAASLAEAGFIPQGNQQSITTTNTNKLN